MPKKGLKDIDAPSIEDLLVLTAHEMGTPLSIAIFQLENIFSKCKNCGEDFGIDFSIAKKSLYQLETVMKNILHMRKCDLGTVHLVRRKTDLCLLLREASVEWELLAREKKIKFVLQIEVQRAYISLDKDLFCHVLENLFGNALKFTPTGGSIQMVLREGNGSFIFQCIDTGIGIPDKHKKSIFRKYSTGNNSKYHGLGLGLFFAKNIVDEHQWTLRVKDSVEGGSIFEICIPMDD